MSAEKPNVEVITSTSRCQQVVRELEKCDVIAMDAEGVQLGKDGPLTLLQIGTVDHVVYLFDITTNRNLFSEGKLQSLLTSPRILKVVHSCSGDSAALYFQFNIRLQNVFDTQVANLVIEESKGRALASLLKLEDLCQKYSKVAKVAEQKDTLKNKWVREVGDLWARRPLTEDMIAYASGDVTAIVPEVYVAMKRYIEENGLNDKFQARVEEEILYHAEESMRERRRQRVEEACREIHKKIDSTYTSSDKFEAIEDEDVKMAINRTHRTEAEKLSPLIYRLKTESVTNDLDELEESFKSEDGIFNIVNGRFGKTLSTGYSFREEEIRDRTKLLQDRVFKITLDHVAKKYDVTSPITHLSRHEKYALSLQRPSPSGEHDQKFNRVVLALYWKLMEAELDSTIEKFEQEPKDFVMNVGHYKKIQFYMHQRNPVPMNIKRKATNFMKNLDRMFGRGIVPRKR